MKRVNMKKPIILLILISNLLLAQPPKGFYPEKLPFGTRIVGTVKHKTNGLSKTMSQNWRCIAQTHYQNTDTSSESINWSFSERDTLIYDGTGNFIQLKSSKAQKGWSIDSLNWTDSCVYDEHNVIQIILMANYGDSGKKSWDLYKYSYPLSGKACVRTCSELKNENGAWTPIFKDSIAYSIPETDFMESIDYTHFIGFYNYTFDSLKLTWNISSSLNRNDSECTANTLVERGGYWLDNNYFNVKQTYFFRSPNWQDANLAEESYQSTNSLTREYYLEKTTHFQDVYGNDTLYFHFIYDTSRSAWDTNSAYRNVRTYDIFGNEIITIESFSYGGLKPSRAEEKIIRTYAQIGQSTAVTQQPSLFPKISMVKTANLIRFIGQGIVAINLYNLSGQLIACMNQKPESGSFSQSISLANSKTSPGMYVAEVAFKNAKSSYLVSIQR